MANTNTSPWSPTYDPYDQIMQQRMNSLRQAVGGGLTSASSGVSLDVDGNEIKAGTVVEILPSSRLCRFGVSPGDRLTVDRVHPDGDPVFSDPRFIREFCSPLDVRIVANTQSSKPAPVKQSVTMDSVILAPDKKELITAALSQVEHHDTIFSTWGFEQVFEKGTAVSMLFWGIPGTGKTLAAQAIADQLKAELKIIGAGEIETSEPGGAERNIKQIFAEASKANTDAIKKVILFDECDSLLMDRNVVGPIVGATINCLLSEIEHYKGVVIFTTNRLGKLDAALERRISAKVEFAFPDEAQRLQIWKRMIPKKAPLEKDVDLTILAHYPLAGGNIKNAVLSAARSAAYHKQKKIKQDNFVQAVQAEISARDDFRRELDKQDHTHIADYDRSDRGGVTISAAQRFKQRTIDKVESLTLKGQQS